MPIAIPIVAAAAVAGLGAGLVGGVAVGAAVFAVSIGLGLVSESLKPSATESQPNQSNFTVQARARTQSVRQPVTSWRIPYGGPVRFSGPVSFLETTNNNHRLHMVIVVSGAEIEEIGTVLVNDEPIYSDEIGADGVVIAPSKFAGFVKIRKYLGTPDQTADPDLVAETSATDRYRWQGRAYIYVRFAFNPDLFPRIPNVSVIGKGVKVVDTRVGGAPAWTPNAALCIRDYMIRPAAQAGFGASAADIDDSWTNSSANVCDEFVEAAALQHETGNARVVDPGTDSLEVDGRVVLFGLGDRVQLSTDGTLPAPLSPATDYYVIPYREFEPRASIKLAASYPDAIAGTPIDITDAGSGRHLIIKNAEPRYQLAGLVETNRRTGEILDDMRSSMAGRVIHTSKWTIRAGFWIAPTLTLEDDDLRAPESITTKRSRRERFNAVQGVFVSLQNLGQPSDYPMVTNAAYEAEDGERLIRPIDMPFTGRASAAQRIAKIELERLRGQEQVLTYPCKFTAYQLEAGSTVNVDNSRFGFVGKPYEVIDFQLQTEQDDNGVPVLGVNLTLQESAAAVYDWNAGEETVTDPAPNTNLPNPTVIEPPGPPVITEETYQTRPGAGVKAKAIITWPPSPDAYVNRYEIQYKLSTATAWTIEANIHLSTGDIAAGVQPLHEMLDLAPDTYDFRIKALNQIGVASDPDLARTDDVEIRGLLDPPVQLQGLTVVAVGGMAKLRWDQSPDLDVVVGGKIVFRHSPALSGALWGASTTIGEAVAGAADNATLPLKPGSYLAKAFDSSGVEGVAAAVVSTKGAQVLQFANLDFIDEAPAFLGVHDDTVPDGGVLRLAGAGLWDDIPDVDALSNVDGYGGIVPAGKYTFAAGIDLGSVKSVRLRSRVTALVESTSDLIDDRGLIDEWHDVDGIDAASADAQVWVQETDSDPAGSPVWSDWQRLDAGEFNARGFRAEARLFSNDPVYNIAVSELGIDVDEVV